MARMNSAHQGSVYMHCTAACTVASPSTDHGKAANGNGWSVYGPSCPNHCC